MVKVNGVMKHLIGQSLVQYLTDEGYNISRIALEYNGDILPKSEYDSKTFAEGDSIEIVAFVGGG